MATRSVTAVKPSGRGGRKKVAAKASKKVARAASKKAVAKKVTAKVPAKKTAKKPAGQLSRAEYRKRLDQGRQRAEKLVRGQNATQIRATAKRLGITRDSDNRPITTRTPVGDIRSAIINRQSRRFANG